MTPSEAPVPGTRPTVPGFDLSRQNAVLEPELLAAVTGVIRSGHFILGEEVQALERLIAQRCGVGFGIGVANGSDALNLALLACGVGPGDEVITTPFTFFATAGAVARAGATPVFCDIDPATLNLDPAGLEAHITSRTKAVIPVHLYGQPADMAPIVEVAHRHGLKVIEDAAQALGATYRGRPVGSLGDLACISFFPTKNLGAFGDAGLVVTDDSELADRVRVLRVHGARRKYHSELLGYNSRLDELQAAILRVKEKYFDQWTGRRRNIAQAYYDGLAGLPQIKTGAVRLPVRVAETGHVYHQFTVAAPKRDGLKAHLAAEGVSSTVYYPCPLHLQAVFESLGYAEGDFPAAERAAREVLSLPMFPELTDSEIGRVIEAVGRFNG